MSEPVKGLHIRKPDPAEEEVFPEKTVENDSGSGTKEEKKNGGKVVIMENREEYREGCGRKFYNGCLTGCFSCCFFWFFLMVSLLTGLAVLFALLLWISGCSYTTVIPC